MNLFSKSNLLLILSIFFSIVLMAQSDEVYPFDGSKPILNCKILNVEDSNLVTFVFNDVRQSIKALAIRKDGEYKVLDHPEKRTNNIKQENTKKFLYQNKTYQYYDRAYKKAIKQKKIGLASGIAGMGIVALGILSFDNNPQVNPGTQDLPIIMMVGGTMLTAYGIPSYFFGRKKEKENLEILQKFPEHQTKLELAITNNGLGLVLKF